MSEYAYSIQQLYLELCMLSCQIDNNVCIVFLVSWNKHA